MPKHIVRSKAHKVSSIIRKSQATKLAWGEYLECGSHQIDLGEKEREREPSATKE